MIAVIAEPLFSAALPAQLLFARDLFLPYRLLAVALRNYLYRALLPPLLPNAAYWMAFRN